MLYNYFCFDSVEIRIMFFFHFEEHVQDKKKIILTLLSLPLFDFHNCNEYMVSL